MNRKRSENVNSNFELAVRIFQMRSKRLVLVFICLVLLSN
jgi:hypothetical protein